MPIKSIRLKKIKFCTETSAGIQLQKIDQNLYQCRAYKYDGYIKGRYEYF